MGLPLLPMNDVHGKQRLRILSKKIYFQKKDAEKLDFNVVKSNRLLSIFSGTLHRLWNLYRDVEFVCSCLILILSKLQHQLIIVLFN